MKSHRLILVACVALALGATITTGAFTGGDEAVRGVYLNPADSENGDRYAEFDDDGQLRIELTNLLARSTTTVDDVFTIGTDLREARVWIDDDRPAVTFYRMDTGDAIETRSDAVPLARQETVDVGIRVESGADEVVLEQVTLRARIPEQNSGGTGGGTPTATDTPTDTSTPWQRDDDDDDDEHYPRTPTPTPTETVDVGTPLPEPNVSVTSDGDRVNVSVENGLARRPVTAELTETSATRSAGVRLDSTTLTPACRGDTGARFLTRTEPSGPTPAGTRALFAYDVTVDEGSCGFERSTTRIRVDREHVDGGPATPSAVTALRRPDDGAEWETANTALVATTDEHYVYEVATASFSEFAVVVREPAFETTRLTVDPAEAATGEAVRLNGTVENVGVGQGEVTAEIAVDGDVVVTRTAVLDPGESMDISGATSRSSPGTYAVSLGEATRTLTVSERSTATTTEAPPTDQSLEVGGLSLPALGVLLAALAALFVVFAYRRRRTAEAVEASSPPSEEAGSGEGGTDPDAGRDDA